MSINQSAHLVNFSFRDIFWLVVIFKRLSGRYTSGFSSCCVESDATKSRNACLHRDVPQRQTARRYSSMLDVTAP